MRTAERWIERLLLLLATPLVFIVTVAIYVWWFGPLDWDEYWETFSKEFMRQWREA